MNLPESPTSPTVPENHEQAEAMRLAGWKFFDYNENGEEVWSPPHWRVLPGYYTTEEAAVHLSISKQMVVKAAKRENWQSRKVGNVHLYRADDVHEYRDHRQRTKLARALGWHYPGPGQGLYRIGDIDIECPVCGSFAVQWPPPPEVQIKYLCLNGHEGEIYE